MSVLSYAHALIRSVCMKKPFVFGHGLALVIVLLLFTDLLNGNTLIRRVYLSSASN